jgi:elongation factor Tu
MELRELLSSYEFPCDEIPIIRGSARDVLECTSTDQVIPQYKCNLDLMKAVEEYNPPPPCHRPPFLMPVEDEFSITGRGTVATVCGTWHNQGRRGSRNRRSHGSAKKTFDTGVEMFRKLLDQAQAGDNIGALLVACRCGHRRGRFWPSPDPSPPTPSSTLRVMV